MSGKQAKRKRRLERGVSDCPSLPPGATAGGALHTSGHPHADVSARSLVDRAEGEAIASPSHPPVLLTLREVAEMLNLSPRTVQRLEKDHGLPGRVELGRTVRYHRGIIEKWLLERVKN